MMVAEPTLTEDIQQKLVISRHALERFFQRYEEITGETLTAETAQQKLREIVAAAVPETEQDNPWLTTRLVNYEGNGQYFINPPWRIVISDNYVLITVEIFPGYCEKPVNPAVPADATWRKMFLAVEEDPVNNCTTILKSLVDEVRPGVPWSVMRFPEIVEINAIVRCLRFIGIKANYQPLTLGVKSERKSSFFVIMLPPKIAAYEVIDVRFTSRLIAVYFGINALCPRGQKYILCRGITKKRLEEVLAFVTNAEWQRAMIELLEQRQRDAELDKLMPGLQMDQQIPGRQLEDLGSFTVSYGQDFDRRRGYNKSWRGTGQFFLRNGGKTFQSASYTALTKQRVKNIIRIDLNQQVAKWFINQGWFINQRRMVLQRVLRFRHLPPLSKEVERVRKVL